MPLPLFDIPSCARIDDESNTGFPAGGFGGGHFTLTRAGEFRRWRLHPGLPERDEPVLSDRFYVWLRQGRHATACPLEATSRDSQHATCNQFRLFPFTWRAYVLPSPLPSITPSPLRLESLSFSPLLPSPAREASLPIYVVVWRAHNPTDEPLEAALMLTWVCGWPDLVSGASFDFQHDKLCLTGSLGDPDSPNRMGIAVPDLHSEGIYRQGIEPWNAAGDGAEVWEDFVEDGELDPALAHGTPQGAAAWVQFALDPDETKEIPFILVWHFPFYESGPATGQPRYYTQFLGKRRPDNAIVWLAEQAVQDYGAETANYRYWIQQIRDWQRPVLEDPLLSPEEKRRQFNRLAVLLEADSIWTDNGRFQLLLREGQTWEGLRGSLAGALPLDELWPEVARALERPG